MQTLFNIYVTSQGLMLMSLVQSDHFHQLTSTGAWWEDQRWQENSGSHLWNTLSGTVSTCRSHRNHCQVLRLASLKLGMRGECSSHLLNKIQMAVGSHWAGCNTQQWVFRTSRPPNHHTENLVSKFKIKSMEQFKRNYLTLLDKTCFEKASCFKHVWYTIIYYG